MFTEVHSGPVIVVFMWMVILSNHILIPMSSGCSSLKLINLQLGKLAHKHRCLTISQNSLHCSLINFSFSPPQFQLLTLYPIFTTFSSLFWVDNIYRLLLASQSLASSQALTPFFPLIYRSRKVLDRKPIDSSLRSMKFISRVFAFCLSN